MKVAYFDCLTGLAGDMCLGALIDAGVPLDYIDQQLQSLGLSDEYELMAQQRILNGQRATHVKVDVKKSSGSLKEESSQGFELDQSSQSHRGAEFHKHSAQNDYVEQAHSHNHANGDRHLPKIKQMIQMSALPSRVKLWSIDIFTILAKAEGAVHGILPSEVHFHEVGATDAIVDIVGTCLGLDWLSIQQVYCSALPTGGGTVWAAHGRLPVPAPAVLKLFEMGQVPIYSNGIERELVTPTGAAIATTLAVAFGRPPAMTLQKVGLGAGTIELPIPNMVRLWIGEMDDGAIASHRHASQKVKELGVKESESKSSNLSNQSSIQKHTRPDIDAAQGDADVFAQREGSQTCHADDEAFAETTVAVLETQIDDLSPQALGYLFPVLLEAGALDVFTQPVGMKKCRPGTLLSVICKPEQAEVCETIIFRETTTLGIRHRSETRTELYREIQAVQTLYGTVRLKLGRANANAPVLNVQPEYEDCVQLAQKCGVPWLQVHQMAIAIYTQTIQPRL